MDRHTDKKTDTDRKGVITWWANEVEENEATGWLFGATENIDKKEGQKREPDQIEGQKFLSLNMFMTFSSAFQTPSIAIFPEGRN